jgi:hypothetical protein
MDDALHELTRAWLVKAQHDLATARKLSLGPDPLLDTAIYHCQQAAEKWNPTDQSLTRPWLLLRNFVLLCSRYYPLMSTRGDLRRSCSCST